MDAWDHKLNKVKCLAGFLNDPLDHYMANCKFVSHHGHMYVETLVPIQQHDELLVLYGGDYWLNNTFSPTITAKACQIYRTTTTAEAWAAKMVAVQDIDIAQNVTVSLRAHTNELELRQVQAAGALKEETQEGVLDSKLGLDLCTHWKRVRYAE